MGTTIENVIELIQAALREAEYLRDVAGRTPQGREASILATDLEKVLAYAYLSKTNKELRRADEDQRRFETESGENPDEAE